MLLPEQLQRGIERMQAVDKEVVAVEVAAIIQAGAAKIQIDLGDVVRIGSLATHTEELGPRSCRRVVVVGI
jgi:ATP phosphoribosyltransferase regulatory subunit HisZ